MFCSKILTLYTHIAFDQREKVAFEELFAASSDSFLDTNGIATTFDYNRIVQDDTKESTIGTAKHSYSYSR